MAGLRIVDVRDDLLRLLGIESAGSASAGIIADILAAINSSLQTMRLAGPSFFTRAAITVPLVEGTKSYDLADTVQSVLGPFRLPNGRTLRKLETRAEFDNFGMLYLGQTNPILDDDEPAAYFVEALNQSGNDPVKITLHIAPAPDAESEGDATIEGVSQVSQYTDAAAVTVIPVPQQYSEKLFLPLARRAISRSNYFSSQDLQEKIEADYQEAMIALGLADARRNEKEEPA